MMKQFFVLSICAVAVIVAIVPHSVAQTDPCIGTYQFYCGDQLMPGTLTCPTYGPCLATCFIPKDSCSPASSAAETCPTCPAAGAPISLATGNTYMVQTDVSLPGLAGGMKLVRTWNSKWPQSQSAIKVGLFGPNWRSTYEERIFAGGDGYIRYARSDGSFWSFGFSNINTYKIVAPANEVATLTYGITTWTLTLKNGETRIFDYASGDLTSIVDRNGNTTQLTYDSTWRLVTVTDPVNQHLYFHYANPSSYYLVTSVTSDTGIALSYAYDDQGKLVQVTKPDNTTLSFQYDSQSLITAVTDSSSKVIESHSYDLLGRGLTSSRANGVEAVAINY